MECAIKQCACTHVRTRTCTHTCTHRDLLLCTAKTWQNLNTGARFGPYRRIKLGMDRGMDRWKNWLMYKLINGMNNKWRQKWMFGWVDRGKDGWMEEWKSRYMAGLNKWCVRWMEGWTDRQNIINLPYSWSSEFHLNSVITVFQFPYLYFHYICHLFEICPYEF